MLAASLVALVPAALAAQSAVPIDSMLDRLVAEARAANPRLLGDEAMARAAAARVRAAGALPDPMLDLGVMDLTLPAFSFRRSDFTEVDVGISQEFPWPGTLGARTRAARAELGARTADASARRRELTVQVADRYYRVRYLVTARETLQRQRALLQTAVEIATARYATGSVPQSDPLQARVARARLDADAAALAAEEAGARAELRALRRAPAESLALAPLPVLADSMWRAHERFGLALTDNALEQHPRLLARREALEVARQTVAVERLGARPDFTLSARYGARPLGSDFFSAFVGVRLPLWAGRKQLRLADAARAESEAASAALAGEETALSAELARTRADITGGAERIRLLADQVVPAADATVEAALRSYGVGQADFLSVLSAEDALYRARLELASVTAEHFTHLVMLHELVRPEGAR